VQGMMNNHALVCSSARPRAGGCSKHALPLHSCPPSQWLRLQLSCAQCCATRLPTVLGRHGLC
jgi:hypothetical protein